MDPRIYKKCETECLMSHHHLALKHGESMETNRYVLSLFSSAGIGELGIRASGFKILLSNELLKSRCLLYEENFPETKSLCGDTKEVGKFF